MKRDVAVISLAPLFLRQKAAENPSVPHRIIHHGRETLEKKFREELRKKGYAERNGYHLNGGSVEVKATMKERGNVVGVLIATSYKYEKIANKEYEKESGGDGSGVL